MTYDVIMMPKALRDLDSLSPDVARRILRKIDAMRNDLAGDVKRLVHFTPEYRLRAGIIGFSSISKETGFSYRRSSTGAKPMIDDPESTMLELHPEFLKKNGQNEFVVLPYDEFVRLQELLEDAEDLLDLRQAREENAGQPGTPLADVIKRYGMAE